MLVQIFVHFLINIIKHNTMFTSVSFIGVPGEQGPVGPAGAAGQRGPPGLQG